MRLLSSTRTVPRVGYALNSLFQLPPQLSDSTIGPILQETKSYGIPARPDTEETTRRGCQRHCCSVRVILDTTSRVKVAYPPLSRATHALHLHALIERWRYIPAAMNHHKQTFPGFSFGYVQPRTQCYKDISSGIERVGKQMSYARKCIICKYTVPISRRMNSSHTSSVESSTMFNQSFIAAIHGKVSFHLDTLPGAKTSRSAARTRLSPCLDANHRGHLFSLFPSSPNPAVTTYQHQRHPSHWLSRPLMECARKRKLGSDKSAGS